MKGGEKLHSKKRDCRLQWPTNKALPQTPNAEQFTKG